MHTWQAVLLAGGLIAAAIAIRQPAPPAVAQQSVRVESVPLAECILEHHRVGSDEMARNVVGACRKTLGMD